MNLSIVETADYNRLKRRAIELLESGMEFWGVVQEIRDRRLYLAEFGTFKEFGDKILHMSDSHIRQRCLEWKYWDAEKLLAETGQVDPEKSEVLQAKNPRQVRKAMEKERAAETVAKSDAADNKDKEDKVKRETLDDIGVPMPEQVVQLWARGAEAQDLVLTLQGVKRVLEQAQKKEDLLWAETEINSALMSLGDAIRQIKTAVPYALCPYCQGVRSKSCDFCYHRGLVSKFRFSTADQELIKMQMKKAQQ